MSHSSGPSVMLAVQGEGRGHLTQAVTVCELLQAEGYDVCCVVVGCRGSMRIPDFLSRRLTVPLVPVASPSFTLRGGRSLDLSSTVFRNLLRLPSFIRSLRVIHRLVRYHKPDVVIQFYEPLVALYRFTHRYKGRIVSVAHQYVYMHDRFILPAGGRLEGLLLKAYTGLTAAGSTRILALSLHGMPSPRDARVRVIPPLLRREVLTAMPVSEGFLLVYIVNAGYMRDVIEWHSRHPGVRVHCFTDSLQVLEEHRGCWRFDDTLSFHSLDDILFADMLRRCAALSTTAGFEAVCEAAYLGKPVAMLPVEGHLEQLCNAHDAERAGIGRRMERFDPSFLLEGGAQAREPETAFRRWVQDAPGMFLRELGSLLSKDALLVEMPQGGAEGRVVGGDSRRARPA